MSSFLKTVATYILFVFFLLVCVLYNLDFLKSILKNSLYFILVMAYRKIDYMTADISLFTYEIPIGLSDNNNFTFNKQS